MSRHCKPLQQVPVVRAARQAYFFANLGLFIDISPSKKAVTPCKAPESMKRRLSGQCPPSKDRRTGDEFERGSQAIYSAGRTMVSS